jgi:hypothetical protein
MLMATPSASVAPAFFALAVCVVMHPTQRRLIATANAISSR